MGFGRFFSETWVGSKPYFRPSDCMSVEVDKSYVSGYDIPLAAIFPLCPNVRYSIYYNYSGISRYSKKDKGHVKEIKDLKNEYLSQFDRYLNLSHLYGSPCQEAFTLTSQEAFQEIIGSYFESKKLSKTTLLQMQIKRSLAWYGKKPALLISWWSSYMSRKSNSVSHKFLLTIMILTAFLKIEKTDPRTSPTTGGEKYID